MALNATILLPPPPKPPSPQGPPKTNNSFVGHILDNKYTLSALMSEDLARQERFYQVSCSILCSDTTIYAKEFSLTNIPPQLYQSRRRIIRNFASKRNVLSCVNYCGKKFVVFDTKPKEIDRKGKGKALDPELDEEEDEAAHSAQEGISDYQKSQCDAESRISQMFNQQIATGDAAPLLRDAPDEEKKPNPPQTRRPRPRRGKRRAKPSETKGASDTPQAQKRRSSPAWMYKGKITAHFAESANEDSEESSDSDWDSMDEDLDEELQQVALAEAAQEAHELKLAKEASLREENDRFLGDLERALRLSSLGEKK